MIPAIAVNQNIFRRGLYEILKMIDKIFLIKKEKSICIINILLLQEELDFWAHMWYDYYSKREIK